MLVLLFSVVFVVVANVWRVAEMVKRSAMGVGGFVAHLGLAVLMGGLILSRGYERTAKLEVREGAPASGMGYTVAYTGSTTSDFFDRERKLKFEVTAPDGKSFTMLAGHYHYGRPDQPKDQVWPAIERFGTHDVYLATSPPQVMATAEPIPMHPGETKEIGDSSTILEYLAPTNNGKFGQVGAEFGAKLRLTVTDAQGERRQFLATPGVRLTEEGMEPTLPRFGPDYKVALIGGIDAKDKGVQVALLFSPPIYFVELYEKPFTNLVWLGTGIMTFGGLMSAFARRRVAARRRQTASVPRSDAPLPAPQS